MQEIALHNIVLLKQSYMAVSRVQGKESDCFGWLSRNLSVSVQPSLIVGEPQEVAR